jgi:hypothetical protein
MRRILVLLATMVMGVVLASGVTLAQAIEEQVITSDGPLTSIAIGNDLSCQVDHEGNGAGGEFYDGQASALATDCGTLLAVGDTTFGKYYSDFTPVSQSDVVGSGTSLSPFRVTTVVDVGDTGLRITQTDSYVVGNDFYTTRVSVKNRGTSRQGDVVLYKFADCYLNGTDENTRGKVIYTPPGRAPACESTDPNAPEEISLVPISDGSTYHAGYYEGIYDAPDIQAPYANTCDDCPDEVDSGVGLSWELSINPGLSKTKTHATKVDIPSPQS